MKKNILKYFLLTSSLFVLIIIYLSTIGLETETFNNQIQNKVSQLNKNLKIELKKLKLTLDPLKFKINAKTIAPKVLYKGKNLELEYIKSQISLISLIKNKFVSSKLELSTKSILLKDLVTFIRATSNKSELLILEKVIKKGQIIANVELNFDENGDIKKDYKINTILKNGKLELFKNYNFEEINFFLNIKNNNFIFKDINFITNKVKFNSDNFRITQNKNFFLLEGEIQNKNSILNNEILELINSNLKNLNFLDTSFSSKNKFFFNIDKKFKIHNLNIVSEIKINKSTYLKPILFNDYFPNLNNLINIKDHKINIQYKKNDLILEGLGKIKLENDYNKIEYKITNKKNIFDINSKIELSELKLKNRKFLKPFFPKTNELIDLKDQLIQINYNKDFLSIKGSGKIKIEKEFENIDFLISKIKDKFNFDTQIDLEKTPFNIDFLNFKKDKDSKIQLIIAGNYNNQNELKLNKVNIKENKNEIILENLLLDKDNLIIRVDKIDLDYFDTENKKNKFLLSRKKENNYKISGSLFNANKLIDDLLKSKSNDDTKVFKSDINLILELNKVYIDEKNTVKDLKGKLNIRDNKIVKADISSLFDQKGNLTFSVNTNKNGEKITTFNSSKAKPIVKRYEFIKGFEGGYLDFSSTKKNNISNSVLIIDNFKVQEVPVLAKLLSLASLQGIADLLTGEGIRFTDFEMTFSNNKDLMTIEELYAIGPSISLLIDGYIQSNKLISLRGTLVPATTVNRSIASIPVIGDLLIGKKVGEGVFGVSFKVKGPPKNLKTTVNPIKTLTPRFITRTLEKIKKN